MIKRLLKIMAVLMASAVVSSAAVTGISVSAAESDKTGVIPSVEYKTTIYSLDDYLLAMKRTARSNDEIKNAVAAAENYVPYVDNSKLKYFPEIRNQSGPTCVVWGAVYYQFTHQVNKALDRAATDSATFNPTFIYNLYIGGRYTHLEELLNTTGCAPLSMAPDITDLKTWNSEYDIWREAANYRISSYMTYGKIGRKGSLITSADDPDLDALKATLRNGDVISCSAYCDADGRPWFATEKIKAAPGVDEELVGQQIATKVHMQTQKMAHMLTIVGYNDNIWVDINKNGKADNGEMGALKIANSWGKNWGSDGFIWLAYDALNEQSVVDGVAYDSDRLVGFDSGFYKMIVSKEYGTSGIFLEYTLNSDNRTDSYIEITAKRKTDGMTYTRCINPYSSVNYKSASGQKLNYKGKTGFCDGSMVTDLNTVIDGLDSNTFHDYTWSIRFVDNGTDSSPTTVKEAFIVDENTKKTYEINAQFPLSLNKSEKTASLKNYYHFAKLYVPDASTLTVGSELKFTFKTANETFGTAPVKYTMTITKDGKQVFSKLHKASYTDKANGASVIKGTWKPTQTGTYTITVSGTDASGATASRSAVFRVYNKLLAVRSINIDKGKYLNQYDSVKITPQVTGGTAPYTYSYYYIKGGKTVKIAENTKYSTKTKTFNAKTGKYTILVKVKDAKGTIAQSSISVVVYPAQVTQFIYNNSNGKVGDSVYVRADVNYCPDFIKDTEYIYTAEKDGKTELLKYSDPKWPNQVVWKPQENGTYNITCTVKYGDQILTFKTVPYEVGATQTVSKKTINVNVITYICNETGTGSFMVHYWNSKGVSDDAKCVALNTTKTKNVCFWSTAQTFRQFKVEIPNDSTGYKFHIGDRWFGSDGSTATSNTVYVFNYDYDRCLYTKE